MRTLLASGASLALLAAAPASAQLAVGLRVGYAPAAGERTEGSRMADTVKAHVPVQLDALYELAPRIAAGAYLSWGLGVLGGPEKAKCDLVGASCSASVTRLGVEALYSLDGPSKRLVPWAGLGAGVEWLSITAAMLGAAGAGNTFGIEFLNLQLGGDWRVNDRLLAGPYLALSIGQYLSVEGTSIANRAVHEWFGFGIRARYRP